MFTSCQKDDEHHRDTVTLKAIIADTPNTSGNSKVYIDTVTENSVMKYYSAWHNGDSVAINDVTKAKWNVLSVDNVEGNNAASISGVDATAPYLAVYPARNAVSITPAGAKATVRVPAIQKYKTETAIASEGDRYQYIEMPMVAYTAADVLKFRNVGGVLAVTVTNSCTTSMTLYAIEVQAATQMLAGQMAVDMSDSPTVTSQDADSSHSVTLQFDQSGTDMVTLAAATSKTFYIPVAPVTSATKFLIHVMATGGDSKKYTFHRQTRDLSIAMNQIGSLTCALDISSSLAFTVSNAYFWGKGTEACPYLITCKDDLLQLRTLVSGNTSPSVYNTNEVYYAQTDTIDLSSETTWGKTESPANYAIGCSTYHFKANYDGGEKYVRLGIANLSDKIAANNGLGLFGTVSGGGSIKNLTVIGSIATNSSRNISIGAIAGVVCGDFSFDNCRSEVSYTTTSNSNYTSQYYGGICGSVAASGCTVTIKNCKNSGILSKTYGALGGICGYVSAGSVSFIGDINNGSITHNYGAATQSSGGICGYSAVASSFSQCENNAELTGSAYYLGGILGKSGAASTFLNCTNSKSISGTGYIGGIVGSDGGASTYTGCVNSGAISGSGSHIGGIVGYANSTIEIHDGSSNTADVSSSSGNKIGGLIGNATAGVIIEGVVANTGDVTGANYVGGLVGTVAGSLNFKANASGSNSGTVSGAYRVGGISGYVNSNFYLHNGISVLNSGRVNASAKSVGGFVGRVEGSIVEENVTTSYTLSTANNTQGYGVSGTDTIGGFFGYVKDASTIGGTSINNASVSGTQFVGGMIGYATNAITLKGNCSNTGAISSTTDRAGGIIGQAGGGVTASSGVVANSGAVSGTNKIGGIVGISPKVVTFNGSTVSNEGTISGTGNQIGGIIGDLESTSVCNFTNVINRGCISGVSYVGGIIGVGYNLNMTNCSNVKRDLGGGVYNTVVGTTQYVGGIVGCGRKISLTGCVNYTDITASYFIGGLVGAINYEIGTSIINKCVNKGKLTSTRSSKESQVGGIIGHVESANGTTKVLYIRNCKNQGSIEAIGQINGGIVGLVGVNGALVTVYIKNCYCSGTVKGAQYTSGLVGKYVSSVTVENCYFCGTVNCTSTSGSKNSYAIGHINTMIKCYAPTGNAEAPTGFASIAGTNCNTFSSYGTIDENATALYTNLSNWVTTANGTPSTDTYSSWTQDMSTGDNPTPTGYPKFDWE